MLKIFQFKIKVIEKKTTTNSHIFRIPNQSIQFIQKIIGSSVGALKRIRIKFRTKYKTSQDKKFKYYSNSMIQVRNEINAQRLNANNTKKHNHKNNIKLKIISLTLSDDIFAIKSSLGVPKISIIKFNWCMSNIQIIFNLKKFKV